MENSSKVGKSGGKKIPSLDEFPGYRLADILEDELAGEILPADKRVSAPSERARLEAIQKKLHQARRSALCLSGGGIRSATFGLGVVQALAKHKLLTSFDYLSTVSGGGYLGGWLSAWIAHAGNIETVAQGLNKDLRTSDDTERDPESEPIRHLRRYSNYLTPKLGFFSSDTWTLAATVLRNIFLNWLMLIPIAAAVLMLPRLFASFVVRVGPSMSAIVWVLGLGLACKLMATIYSALDLPAWRKIGEKPDAKESELTDGRYGWFCLTPLVLSALLLSAGWFWFVGSFPKRAADYVPWGRLIHWWIPMPGGAWVFVYAVLSASLPAGLIAVVWRRRRVLGTWKEPLAMLATALAGGAGLWFVLHWLFSGLDPYHFNGTVVNYLCFAPSLVLLNFMLMNFIYVVTFSRSTTTEDREWWARSAGWLLIAALAWAAASALVLWGPIAFQVLLYDKTWLRNLIAGLGGATGIATALLGHNERSAAKKREGANGGGPWLALGAIAFLLFLVVYIALGTSWLQAKIFHVPTDRPAPVAGTTAPDYRAFYTATVLQMEVWKILIVAAAFALAGLLVGCLVNVNQFSLHAMYDARLTRAYLGASRAGRGRKPHWFTGFDADDKLKISELAPRSPNKLFHVVNVAMNLVSGKELAWQERMAQSFTVSPLHSGSWLSGYWPSRDYDGGIGLGTAITISGAAANPNMGYHSSPLVAILMTLFNVRLGWWSGNPGPPGQKTWYRKGPPHAALPLLAEAFGYTTSEFPEVNLSDGGHFENLGLYEMILRRCQRIVVVDAGRDTDFAFEDLGNAIRKVRIDFGIRIEIVVTFLEPNKKGMHLARCAVGKIHYEEVDRDAPTGKLIYIKPLLQKTEPVDVKNYATAHPGFPHETTSDQWFSESQLESYRMLGYHSIEEILSDGGSTAASLEDLFTHVESQSARIEARLKEEKVTTVRIAGK